MHHAHAITNADVDIHNGQKTVLGWHGVKHLVFRLGLDAAARVAAAREPDARVAAALRDNSLPPLVAVVARRALHVRRRRPMTSQVRGENSHSIRFQAPHQPPTSMGTP